ncbi:hypothetical protein [Glutamicibacter arilaitensis]|uniref:hypothetical protein n=1 Tax=Glutamicibacter arilaitensis TaxID=256701 RepID=UPI00384CAEE3
MAMGKKGRKPAREIAADTQLRTDSNLQVEPLTPERLRALEAQASSGVAAMKELVELGRSSMPIGSRLVHGATGSLSVSLENIVTEIRDQIDPLLAPPSAVHPLTSIAMNMEQSIAALAPALAEMVTPVSPQLARNLAATENAWRELEAEFGLFTSLEVSALVGSKSPNRSYASEQHSKGKLIAVRRPGGLRYPGFQFDRVEHMILSVISELIGVADSAGRSEASLALWMTSRTGYLDGSRPVDHLSSQPDKVVEAARQSFDIQW